MLWILTKIYLYHIKISKTRKLVKINRCLLPFSFVQYGETTLNTKLSDSMWEFRIDLVWVDIWIILYTCIWFNFSCWWFHLIKHVDFKGCAFWILGCVGRRVSSPFPHLLKNDDVVSCCLDLSAPCISFRVNGLPVQGMFENFSADGLLYPVVSFSAGVKSVVEICLCLTVWLNIVYSVLFVICFQRAVCIFFLVYIYCMNLSTYSKWFLCPISGCQGSFSVWGKTWGVSLPTAARLCSMLWGAAPKSEAEGRAMSEIHLGSWRRETRPHWTLSACHSSYLHSHTSGH